MDNCRVVLLDYSKNGYLSCDCCKMLLLNTSQVSSSPKSADCAVLILMKYTTTGIQESIYYMSSFTLQQLQDSEKHLAEVQWKLYI